MVEDPPLMGRLVPEQTRAYSDCTPDGQPHYLDRCVSLDLRTMRTSDTDPTVGSFVSLNITLHSTDVFGNPLLKINTVLTLVCVSLESRTLALC
jgi:hypothetical protein